jgi:hypothetical protein
MRKAFVEMHVARAEVEREEAIVESETLRQEAAAALM